MNAGHRVTIRDVAQAAGVSVTTVSDSLRGRGRLPQQTRDRVREVARELGYVANAGARNLRRGRTGAIGLYFPHNTINMQYYMDLAMGAAEQALTNELALTLIPAPRDARNVARLPIDGVIVSDPALGDPIVAAFKEMNVPMVTCERDLTPGATPAGVIESDHVVATRNLLDHLAGQGTTDVAIICPTDECSFAYDIRQSYLDWCRDRAVTPMIEDVPFTNVAADITPAVRRLLNQDRPPRAMISVPDGGATAARPHRSRAGSAGARRPVRCFLH